jgi:hypothetical protein
MKVFDKVKVYSAVVALVVACGLVASAQTSLPGVSVVASTVPTNGDLNPYGVAIVPASKGSLTKGDILISNFNNSANLQGTGTTIVQISPEGTVTLFAQINASTLPGPCPGGIGLTTALVALKSGWVIVGSLPTTDGTSATVQAGCLLVLNSQGSVVETLYGSLINGPWDMTAWDSGSSADLFVTDVLNGTKAAGGKLVYGGTVVRVAISGLYGAMPNLESITVIASGFPERTDPAALVIGPTGLALSGNAETLYVADSLHNRVASISDPATRVTSAGTATTVSEGGFLSDPLGLTVAMNGDVLAANGSNGFLVTITPGGDQTSETLLDNTGTPPGAGALFGLEPAAQGLYYVDDASNTLNLFQ